MLLSSCWGRKLFRPPSYIFRVLEIKIATGISRIFICCSNYCPMPTQILTYIFVPPAVSKQRNFTGRTRGIFSLGNANVQINSTQYRGSSWTTLICPPTFEFLSTRYGNSNGFVQSLVIASEPTQNTRRSILNLKLDQFYSGTIPSQSWMKIPQLDILDYVVIKPWLFIVELHMPVEHGNVTEDLWCFIYTFCLVFLINHFLY